MSSLSGLVSGTEDDNIVKTVLILVAMEQEAQLFIDAFGLTEEEVKEFPLSKIPSRQFHRHYVPNVAAATAAGNDGLDVYLVTNGRDERFDCNNVGTTPAAISAFTAITMLKPDLVINAGTAGGFHRVGGAIGDVYLCNYFTHHDRRIPLSEKEVQDMAAKRAAESSAVPPPAPAGMHKGSLSPHNAYLKGSATMGANSSGSIAQCDSVAESSSSNRSSRVGGSDGPTLPRDDTLAQLHPHTDHNDNNSNSSSSSSDSKAAVVYHEYGYGKHQQLHLTHLVDCLHCKRGNVSTSNSLDHTERDDEFMLVNGAHVKDMEAAAIAWVIENCCRHHRESGSKAGQSIPFFAIKVVTDIVDGHTPTQEEFLSNLSHASKTLCETLIRVVEFIAEKKLLDLL